MADRSVVVRLRAEVAEFKAAMAEATAATKKVADESTRAAQAASKASDQQTTAAQRSAKAAEDAAAKTSTASSRLVKSAQDNEQAWQRAGVALTAFGVLAGSALLASVNAAVQWESAWAGVTKTIDGTPAQLAAVEDGLRALARTLPATHGEIAAVAEAAGQLGVATDDVVAFTKVMIDLGETTNLTADEAATAIAQLMNIMGTAPADVDRLGAALVALGNNGASTERDIIQMSQRIAAAGKIVGLTEAEVMAFANAIASVGIEVEAGGTAISRVMTDMAKAVSTGSDDLSRFATVAGMSADQFATAFRERPAEAITAFVEGLGQIQAAGGDVFTTLDELSLSDVRVSQALLSMANAGDLLRESLALGNTAWAENTALIDEAAKRYDTTAAKIQIAQNNIRDAGISIGESLTPALATAADAVADLAGWFAQLPAPVTGALGALTGVAAVTALVAGGFLLTFPRVIETVKAFRQLQTIAPGIAGKLSGIAGIATRATLAIAGLGIALGVLNKGLDARDTVSQYTRAILDLQNAAKSGSGAVIDDLGRAFTVIQDGAGGLEGVENALSNVNRLFGGMSNVDMLRSRFELLGQSLESIYQSNPELAAQKFDEILAITGGTTQELLDLMPAYRDALADVANAQDIAAQSTTGTHDTFAEFLGITEELTDAQQNLVDAAKETASAFVDPTAAYEDLAAAADGAVVSLDAWITRLEEQAAAQAEWATNMVLLSGRVSQGVLTKLAEMGPAGAQYVADLVNSTGDEIARLEPILGDGAQAGVDAIANILLVSGPVIAAASAQLGAGAAAEIAAKLSSGTATVEQVIAEYGLIIEGYQPTVTVEADTEQAVADLGTVIEVAYTTGQQYPIITVTQDGVPQTVADLETAIAMAQTTDGQAPIVTVTTDGVPQSVADLESVTGAARGVPGSTLTTTNTAGTGPAIGALNSVRDSVFGIPTSRTVTINVVRTYSNAQGPAGSTGNLYAGYGNQGGLIAYGRVVRGYAAGGLVPGNPPANKFEDNVLARGPGGLFALRSGEWVSTEDSTRRNRAALLAGNKGATLTVASYAGGGQIGHAAAAAPSLGGMTAEDVRAAVRAGVAEAMTSGVMNARFGNPRALATYIDAELTLAASRQAGGR